MIKIFTVKSFWSLVSLDVDENLENQPTKEKESMCKDIRK